MRHRLENFLIARFLLLVSAPKKQRHRGFNLIEAAIVLGVIGLVLGGVWVAASAVERNRKLTRMLEQLVVINEKLNNSFKGFDMTAVSFDIIDCPSFGLSCIPKASWSAFVPLDMIGPGARPITPWGTEVEITSNSNTSFLVNISLPDVSVCAVLGPRIFSTMSQSLYSDGNYPLVRTGANAGDITTPTVAVTSCQAEYDDTGTAGISFEFKR